MAKIRSNFKSHRAGGGKEEEEEEEEEQGGAAAAISFSHRPFTESIPGNQHDRDVGGGKQ